VNFLARPEKNIFVRDFLCAERTPAAFPNKIGEDSLWRKGQKISRSHFVNIERGINKRKGFNFFSEFASVCLVAKKEIKETAPLKGNLVSVFYTENVFIAESGGNIHCANHFENFIQEGQQVRGGL